MTDLQPPTSYMPGATTPTGPTGPRGPAGRARSRVPLIAGVVVVVLALMAGTGAAVWWLTGRDAPAGGGAGAASAAPTGTLIISGRVRLVRPQFEWLSVSDPTCYGRGGFSDIRATAQVTVTDAGGTVLKVGMLDRGVAEVGSDNIATACNLPFRVVAVPRGAGPYGVEVTHRGVTRYEEGSATSIVLGFN